MANRVAGGGFFQKYSKIGGSQLSDVWAQKSLEMQNDSQVIHKSTLFLEEALLLATPL